MIGNYTFQHTGVELKEAFLNVRKIEFFNTKEKFGPEPDLELLDFAKVVCTFEIFASKETFLDETKNALDNVVVFTVPMKEFIANGPDPVASAYYFLQEKYDWASVMTLSNSI